MQNCIRGCFLVRFLVINGQYPILAIIANAYLHAIKHICCFIKFTYNNIYFLFKNYLRHYHAVSAP